MDAKMKTVLERMANDDCKHLTPDESRNIRFAILDIERMEKELDEVKKTAQDGWAAAARDRSRAEKAEGERDAEAEKKDRAGRLLEEAIRTNKQLMERIAGVATVQAFVCESPSGYKVVISKHPYHELHPDNNILVKDGLRRDDAWKLRKECDEILGNVPKEQYQPRKYS